MLRRQTDGRIVIKVNDKGEYNQAASILRLRDISRLVRPSFHQRLLPQGRLQQSHQTR